MPLYEYECNECLTEEDRLVSLGERDAPIACPSCHTGVLKRKPSAPFVAAIPGIPNRLNKDWNESGASIESTRYRRAKGDDRPVLG